MILALPWESETVRVEVLGPGRDEGTVRVKLAPMKPGWSPDVFLVKAEWLREETP